MLSQIQLTQILPAMGESVSQNTYRPGPDTGFPDLLGRAMDRQQGPPPREQGISAQDGSRADGTRAARQRDAQHERPQGMERHTKEASAQEGIRRRPRHQRRETAPDQLERLAEKVASGQELTPEENAQLAAAIKAQIKAEEQGTTGPFDAISEELRARLMEAAQQAGLDLLQEDLTAAGLDQAAAAALAILADKATSVQTLADADTVSQTLVEDIDADALFSGLQDRKGILDALNSLTAKMEEKGLLPEGWKFTGPFRSEFSQAVEGAEPGNNILGQNTEGILSSKERAQLLHIDGEAGQAQGRGAKLAEQGLDAEQALGQERQILPETSLKTNSEGQRNRLRAGHETNTEANLSPGTIEAALGKKNGQSDGVARDGTAIEEAKAFVPTGKDSSRTEDKGNELHARVVKEQSGTGQERGARPHASETVQANHRHEMGQTAMREHSGMNQPGHQMGQGIQAGDQPVAKGGHEAQVQIQTVTMASHARNDSSFRAMASETVKLSVSEQLSQGMTEAIRMNRNRAVLHLNPPELGRVRITLSVTGNNHVQASFVAEHPETRQIIESSMAQLRQQLQQQGFSLGDLNVGLQDRRDAEQNDNFARSFMEPRHRSDNVPAGLQGVMDIDPATSPAGLTRPGGIHVVV